MTDANGVEIKVGDEVVIHKYEGLCVGFDAKEQLLYAVGTTHVVDSVTSGGVRLKGSTILWWRKNEIKKVGDKV